MNELDQYLNARAYEITDSYAEMHKDEVLEFLLLRGLSYATEISRATSMHIDTVNKILNHLNNLKFIQNFIVDFDNPQRIFIPRMLELWARNIYGVDRLATFNWWIITEAGFEYFKAKFSGQGKKIIASIVKHYGWFILEEQQAEFKPLPNEIKEILKSDVEPKDLNSSMITNNSNQEIDYSQ